MTGATLSPGGGVWGRAFVFICDGSLPVRDRSGECDGELATIVVELELEVCDCLSGKMAPILEATLPLLASAAPALFSFWSMLPKPPPVFRSGLVRRGLKASRSLPTGDGDRLDGERSAGACRVAVVRADEASEVASVVVEGENVEVRLSPFSPSSCNSD